MSDLFGNNNGYGDGYGGNNNGMLGGLGNNGYNGYNTNNNNYGAGLTQDAALNAQFVQQQARESAEMTRMNMAESHLQDQEAMTGQVVNTLNTMNKVAEDVANEVCKSLLGEFKQTASLADQV